MDAGITDRSHYSGYTQCKRLFTLRHCFPPQSSIARTPPSTSANRLECAKPAPLELDRAARILVRHLASLFFVGAGHKEAISDLHFTERIPQQKFPVRYLGFPFQSLETHSFSLYGASGGLVHSSRSRLSNPLRDVHKRSAVLASRERPLAKWCDGTGCHPSARFHKHCVILARP